MIKSNQIKKIFVSFCCFATLTLSTVEAQETKTKVLEKFSKVNLEGNIEMHLAEGFTSSVKIETRRAADLVDLEITVRNNELFIAYKKNINKTPKFIVYLEHNGIHELDMVGMISLFSQEIMKGPNLTLKGSGIVKGELEVEVKNLRIDSDGITKITLSGTADSATFNIEGLGKINARKLETKAIRQNSDGFTKVKVGS